MDINDGGGGGGGGTFLFLVNTSFLILHQLMLMIVHLICYRGIEPNSQFLWPLQLEAVDWVLAVLSTPANNMVKRLTCLALH